MQYKPRQEEDRISDIKFTLFQCDLVFTWQGETCGITGKTTEINMDNRAHNKSAVAEQNHNMFIMLVFKQQEQQQQNSLNVVSVYLSIFSFQILKSNCH